MHVYTCVVWGGWTATRFVNFIFSLLFCALQLELFICADIQLAQTARELQILFGVNCNHISFA